MTRLASRATQARYNRMAPLYDFMEWWGERAFRKWRQRVWSEVGEGRVLEVGIGTGKNLSHKPPAADLLGVDLSPRMLARAARHSRRMGLSSQLAVMDVQALALADRSFDGVVATFVFCSVPDPVRGLRELGRVCREGGRIVLLEHVRSDNPILGRLMDFLNPLVVRITGANINRTTAENVRRARLEVLSVEDMTRGGLVKLITARPRQGEQARSDGAGHQPSVVAVPKP